MILTLIGWFFASFIYYKVSFDAYYNYNITIIGDLLISMILGAVIFGSSGIYAWRLLRYNLASGRVKATIWEILSRTMIPFLLIYIGFSFVSMLVIFGFSKEISDEIDFFYNISRYGMTDDIFAFFLIIGAPLFLHYAMCIFPTWVNARDNHHLE